MSKNLATSIGEKEDLDIDWIPLEEDLDEPPPPFPLAPASVNP